MKGQGLAAAAAAVTALHRVPPLRSAAAETNPHEQAPQVLRRRAQHVELSVPIANWHIVSCYWLGLGI